jgi:hypothetical protein
VTSTDILLIARQRCVHKETVEQAIFFNSLLFSLFSGKRQGSADQKSSQNRVRITFNESTINMGLAGAVERTRTSTSCPTSTSS